MLRHSRVLGVSMVILCLGCWLAPAGLRGQSTGNTLYVDSGTPGSFESITNAIAAALPGDTVYVSSGIYIENVVIGKRIDLVGQDRTNTIIVGDGMDHAIKVTADHASVSNFRVHNSIRLTMPESWFPGTTSPSQTTISSRRDTGSFSQELITRPYRTM